METKMHSKRIQYFDYVRCIGIVLMIMGHIGFGGVFDKWIHAFHMPIFFIMSGYFFKEREEISKTILKKVRQLLVPYIVIGVLHYLFYVLIHWGEEDLLIPLKNLLWVNTNDKMPIAGALWFLTCLFWVDVLFMLINKYLKKLLCPLCLLLTVFGCCFSLLFDLRLPWAMDSAMVGIGFYYFGYLLKQKSDAAGKLMKLPLSISMICLIVGSALVILNGGINMRTAKYAIIPLSLLNACLISISLFNICRIAEEKSQNTPFRKVFDAFAYIGENSIVYLCFNQLCILIMKKLCAMLGLLDMNVAVKLAVSLAILIAVLFMLWLLSKLFANKHLKFMVGRTG